MTLWHRHLILLERARREGRLGRAKLQGCFHRWGAFDHFTEQWVCQCGARLSVVEALKPQFIQQ